MKDIFNEMDYRNIPRDMLDKNIPTGRGMVKWAPIRNFTRTVWNNLSIYDRSK